MYLAYYPVLPARTAKDRHNTSVALLVNRDLSGRLAPKRFPVLADRTAQVWSETLSQSGSCRMQIVTSIYMGYSG